IAKRISQLSNRDFENRVADKCFRPNGIEEVFFGDELSGMSDKLVQHCKGFWSQLDNLRAPQQTFVRPVQAQGIEDDVALVAQCVHRRQVKRLKCTRALFCTDECVDAM